MNEEIVRTTIAKMREAGLSDSIIASTLSDLGLSSAQTQAFLSGNAPASSVRPSSAYSNPAAPPVSAIPPRASASSSGSMNDLDHEALASRTSEKVIQRLDERDALSNEEADLKDTITHVAMEQHGQQLQATHQAVMDLHEKFDATSLDTISNRVTAMNAKMDAFSKDVSETKALVLALQSLMQKILEANQQLLFETKTKK